MNTSIKITSTIIIISLAASMPGFSETKPLSPVISTESLATLQNKALSIRTPPITFKKDLLYTDFNDWINRRPLSIHIIREKTKEELREDWEKALGGRDLFYPYFKVKELKIKTENKSSIKLFKIRGKAKLEKDEAIYTFSIKF
ncbi:MAG: hypothetical protein ABIG92_06810 [Candidatus Omnitrophota bacterium]